MAAADLIVSGGAVQTMDAARSWAAAVAVRGDRIVAVGGREVLELAGPATEIVDGRDALLLPGFQDAHVHPVAAGLRSQQLDLAACASRAEYLAAVRAHADATTDDGWVVGSGWQTVLFPRDAPPTRADLDAACPDRPVCLVNIDAHSSWVNSRALRYAGIDRSGPDVARGRIDRDATSEPTGILHDAAMELVAGCIPQARPEQVREALLVAQRHLHSVGVTAWQDALLGSVHGLPDPSAAYRAAAADGTLTARVVGALWWDRQRGLEQLPELLERRRGLSAGPFRASSVKLMLDGVPESLTSALLEPYCVCAGDEPTRGSLFIPPDQLADIAVALDAHDLDMHFHALGDGSVRAALDAVERARRVNGATGTRHQLAHVYLVADEDLPRFRRLGALANMQMLWAVGGAFNDDHLLPVLGPRRAARQHPFAALQAAGATLVAGSDWPVSAPDPMLAVHAAVNRVAHGDPAEPLNVDQRLDLMTALAAYTAGSAYANRFERDSGSLVEGARADLVLLDRNPFDGPAADIGAVRAALTVVGGRVVHRV